MNKNIKSILLFKYVKFIVILSILFSTTIYSDFFYFQSIPDDGTREIAFATDTFREHLLKSMDYKINFLTPGFIKKSVTNVRMFDTNEGMHIVVPYISYKWIEGSPVETGGKLDFCINGSNKAFFTIQLTNNIIGYTRDGRFRKDFEGRLVTISGNFPVIGTNGIIELEDGSNISVSRAGGIYDGSEYVGQLKITVFKYFEEMNNNLHNINGTTFVLTKEVQIDNNPNAYSILQGFITQSNSFESHDSKYYRAYHDLSQQTLYNMIDNQKMLFNTVGN